MTSPKWLSRVPCLLVVGTLLLLSRNAMSQSSSQSRIAGKQFMVARYTKTPPVIDGVFSLAEWGRALPVYVEGTSSPATPPGVVPKIDWLPYLVPPDSPADSSFTIYTLYDDNYLYIAVNVTDDYVYIDSPYAPWLDDDVEIMIDGDRRPGDWNMTSLCGPNGSDPNNCPNTVSNLEGYKLLTTAAGVQWVDPANHPPIVWDSKASRTRTGYVVEFKVSLDSINTSDTSWWTFGSPDAGFRRPQPGDIIGFNVAVGDDDNGGCSYVRNFCSDPIPNPLRSDSFTAWDGRSVGWGVTNEEDWGNLYLAPHGTDD